MTHRPATGGERVGAASWWVFLLLSAIHLTGDLFGWRDLTSVTINLLMLPLAVHVASRLPRTTGRDRRTVIVLLVALFFGWQGDMADDIIVKLGMFAVGHLGYCLVFWRWRWWGRSSAGMTGSRWALVAAYAAAAVILNVVLAGHVGWLLGPFLGYGALLCVMGVLAAGVGRRGLAGGALFLLSDALLAYHLYVAALPLGDLWVMGSYLGAQGLLVRGALMRLSPRSASG